jgi:hypothetical protein
MSDRRVGFHAMCRRRLTEEDADRAFDNAASAIGLALAGVDREADSTTRKYCDPGVTPLDFSYTLRPICQAVVLCGYDRPGSEPYAPPRLAEMFTRICAGLDADLGRSDLGGGYGLIRETELDGPLEFIDWYQYIGPRIVERMGRDRLLASPAFRMTTLESGAIVMQLATGPWDDFSRTKVADHLGIRLRPLTGRNPMTGEPIVLNWG